MVPLDRFPSTERDEVVDGLFVREASPEDGARRRHAVLMVHGAYEGWWVYRKWLSFFATNGWSSYAMSLRNHAGSYRLSDGEYLRTSLADYVDDVRRILSWLDRPTAVIGHSLGGLVVQKVAETEPVAALVLLASVGPSQLGRHADDFPTDRLVDAREDVRAEAAETTLDPDAFADFVAAVGPESPRALNDARGRTPVDRERIACPILAVGAGADQYPIHDARAIARFYGCDCLMLAQSRHGIMLESHALDAAIEVEHWLHGVLEQPESGVARSERARG